jgi:hypothetical protein
MTQKLAVGQTTHLSRQHNIPQATHRFLDHHLTAFEGDPFPK